MEGDLSGVGHFDVPLDCHHFGEEVAGPLEETQLRVALHLVLVDLADEVIACEVVAAELNSEEFGVVRWGARLESESYCEFAGLEGHCLLLLLHN